MNESMGIRMHGLVGGAAYGVIEALIVAAMIGSLVDANLVELLPWMTRLFLPEWLPELLGPGIALLVPLAMLPWAVLYAAFGYALAPYLRWWLLLVAALWLAFVLYFTHQAATEAIEAAKAQAAAAEQANPGAKALEDAGKAFEGLLRRFQR